MFVAEVSFVNANALLNFWSSNMIYSKEIHQSNLLKKLNTQSLELAE